MEAVGRRLRRDNRDGCFAIAAEHRLQEIGLLGLRGQPGRWATALNVDDEQGELKGYREPDGLRLQRYSGTRRRRHRERAAVGRAQGGANAGDFVLRLEGHDAKVLVLAQLVEDVGSGGDRVGAEKEREAREL